LNLALNGASIIGISSHPIVVEQAKGFLREVLDIPVDDAYDLLLRYAQTGDDQRTSQVARRLLHEPDSRPSILAAMRQMLTDPPYRYRL
jgi:hypothetical protein